MLMGTTWYPILYWSHKRIGMYTDLTRRQVIRVLNALKGAGLIYSLYRHGETCLYKVYGSQEQTLLKLRLNHDVTLYNDYILQDQNPTGFWDKHYQKLGRSIVAYEQVRDSGGKEREKMNVSEFIFAISLDCDKKRPTGRSPKAEDSPDFDQNVDHDSQNSCKNQDWEELNQLHEYSLCWLFNQPIHASGKLYPKKGIANYSHPFILK